MLCIPRVLKGSAFMGGCLYSSVVDGSWCVFGLIDVWGALVVCWVWAFWVRFQFL